MNLLTIEIDDGAHKKSTGLAELPIFHGSGGLQPDIDPNSNKSMLEVADPQQVGTTKRLREEATANLMLAIESATLTIQVPLHVQEAASQKTLREELYADDFRAQDPSATSLRKYPAKQKKP